MTPQEFDDKFSKGAASVWLWIHDHGKAATGIICFVLGMIVGKFII